MEAHTSELTVRPAPTRRRPDFGGRDAKRVGSFLIAPGQLLLLFIILFPAAIAIYIGFTSWSPTSGADFWHAYEFWHWFDGYWEALTSTVFWSAMWRTVLITVVCVAVEFALGFALALLLLKNFRGRGLVTVFFLLPMMVVPAVTGFVFFMLFQQGGPVNGALDVVFGVGPVNWLNNADIALWTVMSADIWQWTPLMFLIFLSGLAALPEDQMNASRILGAGFLHQMRYLVLPMMKPIILIALIIRAIEAFKIFDAIYLMTQGGPGDATENISLYIFDLTQQQTRWGFASAVAILVLIFVSVAGFWAVRPIERAQEETLEELTGAEADRESTKPRVEDAIEVEVKA